MIRQFVIALLGSMALCSCLYAREEPKPRHYMLHGIIEHHNGTATVKVNFPDPLEEVVTTLREEYGWVVNFEDPPYAGTDLTAPRDSGSGGSPYKIVAGGAFQSTYPETPNMWSSPAAERRVLEKIVSDYNRGGNPGDFVVRKLSDGSFDVVGTSIHNKSGGEVPITPILDTRISIPRVVRGCAVALNAILEALPVRAEVSAGPTNIMLGGSVTVGGTEIPARQLLMQVIDSWGAKWVWRLTYIPGPPPEYFFSMQLASRVTHGMFGRRRLIPVAPVMTSSW